MGPAGGRTAQGAFRPGAPRASRLRTAAALPLLLALCCGERVDLGRKHGPFSPPLAPDRLSVLQGFAASEELCASGRAAVAFSSPGQAFAFPIRLAQGDVLLVATSGAIGLDTTLSVLGPQRPEGDFGEAPIASDDDSGAFRLATLALAPVPETGTYLLAVSTFDGMGCGEAVVEISVNGERACPHCSGPSASNPFSGCLGAAPCAAPACEEPAQPWEDLWLYARSARAADPCAGLPEGTTGPLRRLEPGADWGAALDAEIALAEHWAGGFGPDQAEALRCLMRATPGRGAHVSSVPGSGAPGYIALRIGLDGSVDARAALLERFHAQIGSMLGAGSDYTFEVVWDDGPEGALEGHFLARSVRGLPILPGTDAVVSVRLHPDSTCGTRYELQSIRSGLTAAIERALEEAPEPIDRAQAVAAALAECGLGCRGPSGGAERLRPPDLVLGSGGLFWDVQLHCPSRCPGVEWTCTYAVDARTGLVESGGEDCCVECEGPIPSPCAPPAVVRSEQELVDLLTGFDWPERTPGEPPTPASPDLRLDGDLVLRASEIVPPAACAQSACSNVAFRVDPALRHAKAEELVAGSTEPGLALVLSLGPGTVRARPELVRDESSGALSAVVTWLPGCHARCSAGHYRCPADGVCRDPMLDVPALAGVRFCTECLGRTAEDCACYAPHGVRPDGSPCRSASGRIGACVQGACTLEEAAGPPCESLYAAWSDLLALPSSRQCAGDEECVIVGGAPSCDEAVVIGAPEGEAVSALAAPSFEALTAAFGSTACAAFRSIWGFRSWQETRAEGARCQDGRCVPTLSSCSFTSSPEVR